MALWGKGLSIDSVTVGALEHRTGDEAEEEELSTGVSASISRCDWTYGLSVLEPLPGEEGAALVGVEEVAAEEVEVATETEEVVEEVAAEEVEEMAADEVAAEEVEKMVVEEVVVEEMAAEEVAAEEAEEVVAAEEVSSVEVGTGVFAPWW